MLTLLTVHDVYEITPVQDTGGLAELMTLLCAERTTATHTLTTINDRGQVPRGRVCIWYASVIKMVAALEEALPRCAAGVCARLRPTLHILSRSAAYRPGE